MTPEEVRALVRECGFELAGVAGTSKMLELMRPVGLEP